MKNTEHIIVNQLGYRVNDYKLAIIDNDEGQFNIIDTTNEQVVWTGQSTILKFDEVSGTDVCQLDFSTFTNEGNFKIEGKKGSSLPFSIGAHNYDAVHADVLKAFYFLRCGVRLEQPYAEKWEHEACHCTPAIVYDNPQQTFDANGGWHDAGDYGKYIVAAGKAVADMLLAYELYPHAFTKQLPLPESNSSMPDILHEVKIELHWMLKMQELKSGGVYHKVTTLSFPPLDMKPEDDLAALYAMPISATATASFAATMSMAARVYATYDSALSKRCIEAAKLAWKWLEEHPQMDTFKNPPGVSTGEYGDTSDTDERYWAAAELYRTTGENVYHKAFIHLAADQTIDKTALGWASMGGYGTITYLLTEYVTETTLVEQLKQVLRLKASELSSIAKADGFAVSMQASNYEWGSNMTLLNHAIILLIAQHIDSHQQYQQEIAAHLHHILGMNVNRYSYISGHGARAMANPHYRPTVADGIEEVIPGFVSGGPNKNLQDECAVEHLTGQAPAACFIDHIDSYSTNEITIYWNSPALFVLSAFV